MSLGHPKGCIFSTEMTSCVHVLFFCCPQGVFWVANKLCGKRWWLICRVEHSHVPELGGQESSRAVDEGVQHLCCYRDCGGCCVLRLWPKQGLVQQIPACSTLKSPGTEHPCGLSCEPLLLCFQLHQPGFTHPFQSHSRCLSCC